MEHNECELAQHRKIQFTMLTDQNNTCIIKLTCLYGVGRARMSVNNNVTGQLQADLLIFTVNFVTVLFLKRQKIKQKWLYNVMSRLLGII